MVTWSNPAHLIAQLLALTLVAPARAARPRLVVAPQGRLDLLKPAALVPLAPGGFVIVAFAARPFLGHVCPTVPVERIPAVLGAVAIVSPPAISIGHLAEASLVLAVESVPTAVTLIFVVSTVIVQSLLASRRPGWSALWEGCRAPAACSGVLQSMCHVPGVARAIRWYATCICAAAP